MQEPCFFFSAEGVLYLSFCLRALASRFQMNFTVREHLRRISFLFTLRKRNARVSTRILQWLVSDKTFSNPLIYQMANPVNSLRNIITCNLFCYSFYAYTSLSLAAYQQARRELKHGCSCRASAMQFPLVTCTRFTGVLPPSLEQREQVGEESTWPKAVADTSPVVRRVPSVAMCEVLFHLCGGNMVD